MQAALVLLVAMALAFMPVSMAYARVAASAQPMLHAGVMADHCADKPAPREEALPHIGSACAIACSIVLPFIPPIAASRDFVAVVLVPADAPTLHGIAIDPGVPPPRNLLES